MKLKTERYLDFYIDFIKRDEYVHYYIYRIGKVDLIYHSVALSKKFAFDEAKLYIDKNK